jgi:serine-type D-Ala-D-Ala carboxypeptidase/endopeptidase (penicillin-binding protein 4)
MSRATKILPGNNSDLLPRCGQNITRVIFFPLPSLLFLILVSSLSFPTTAWTQPVARGENEALVKAINETIDVPGLQSGFQGILVQSLKDQRILYELNTEKNFLPASNNKLLTSCVALEKLGKDFVYRTKVFRTGNLGRDGTLRGDLILRGSGDPLLTPDHLKNLARKIREAGIRRVRGSLCYDDALFDANRLGSSWSWDDEPFYYSAQVSALNVNENVVTVQTRPSKKEGDPVKITVLPTDRYTTLVNTAVTVGPTGKRRIVFDRQRGTNTLLVSGTLPLDTAEKDCPSEPITIEAPSRFAAFLFRESLRESGVRVDKRELREVPQTPSEAIPAAEHVSPPLPDILKRLNKPSNNLVAECLLKTVGATEKQRGTFSANGTGARTALDWFLRIGLDTDRVRMDDGSGLSRTDYVTPRNLVRLLTYMHTCEQFPIFFESLPIAGVDGTLRNRMKNTSAANNCRAKTGTLSFVSSLSGYVTTKDGEPLVFSILMNNHLAPGDVARAAQDKIVTLLADYAHPITK